MATPTLIILLVLTVLQFGPASSGLYTKRYRLRRASGANATVFNHVYNIRMPRCESCAADVAVPTATMQEVRGETTQQQLYEHTLEGEQQMVFTHRINIPPQACGCPSADTLQTLLSRLEALEAQVAAFKDQCPGGTCCAATQAGNGQTEIQGLCNGHGKFDFSKCGCECEKGWGGPTCSDSSCPDNCSGQGKCVDGECLCRVGFAGESCELIACQDDCNDQGRCVKGKCVCFPGYTGPTCGAMSCPEKCRGHGRCVKDVCICDPGFTGPDCGSKACPENCRDRGKCINGTCVCNAGFVGPDCSTPSCPENCNNRGKCVDGKCICSPGYMSPDCGSRSCPENCKNRGQCINGKCICNPGFAGPACGARSCPENCHNHGQCINGKCVCNPGYSGPSCSSRACPDNCNRRGVCEDGKCVCSEGFTGPNCGIKTCPENCQDRGKCEDGKCICQTGFTGLKCETKTCPENCKKRGRCEDGRCICEGGFTGPNCGTKTCPDNCNNRGQCEDGRCICVGGYSGPNCGVKTCPDNCKNRGRCEDGRCICEGGFTGPNCGTKTCPDNCNNRGQCEDGRCICVGGYSGPNCGEKTCPDNCKNRGRCEDGRCICEGGFTGPNCGTKTCPDNCKNRGRCEDGRCICEGGFTGPNCGTKTCPDNCNNQGQCEDGRCICVGGYSGPNCGVKTCPDNCKNRGRCEDGQCVCDEGYTGLDCGTKKCPNNCNSHGQCVDGQCICQAGFTGPNCGTRACPNNCNNRGRCDNGKCVCEEGYAGPICGLKVCPNNCNNRGRCQKGTCICRRGYTGPDCGETTCPGQCQGRGLCVDGSCQCQVGFSGPDCSERTCPNACSQHGKCIDGKCVCQEGFSGEDCSSEVPTVQGLRVKTRQETWVIMEWERPQITVDGYEISFRPTKEEDGVLSSRLRSTITAFNRTGLAPGEEYLVTIRTQKDQTLGPETTQTITTRIDGPKNLRATEKSQSTITLRWDKPAARIDRYLVTYVSSAGVPRQVTVPASAKEVVTLTDLDSGAEYTIAVVAERGSESSVPATTTATTAAADGASGPEQRPSPASDVEEWAAKQGRVRQKMSPSTTTPKVQVTTRIGGERSNQGESLSQRLLFTDGERVVTTVIAGEPHQKELLFNRQPSTSEEERMDTKVVGKGGPIKLEPPKRWPTHNKEERASAVGTTQEPPKSSVPNIRPVIIKRGKVITTVITRAHKKEIPTNEKPSLTKEERFTTTILTGEDVPRVVTSSGRPSLSKNDRVDTLTREGTIQVVSPGVRPIVTKEERVITTVIAEERIKNVVSAEEKSTKLTPIKKTSGTREDSVITSHGKEGSKKISTTDERQPLSKDRKVVATIITGEQTPKGMPPTKSPPLFTKKEQIVTTAIPKEGIKKVVLTDKKIQVTKEGKNVLTGKDISPTQRSLIRMPSVTPVDESKVKGKKVVPTVMTRAQQQNEVPPTKTPSVPKHDKATASTISKDRVKTIVSTDRKPLTTEERAAAAVVSGKQLPKGASPDKKPLLTTKEGVEKKLSAEDSHEVKLVDRKTLQSREETAVVSTSAKIHGSKLAPIDGKTKGTKDMTGLAGTKEAEENDKTIPLGKKPASTNERVVTVTVTKKGHIRVGSSDEKIPPTFETAKTTATTKVTEKKGSATDKKPLYGKDEKTTTKAVTDKQHLPGKKISSVDQDAKAATPTKTDKKLVGGKDTTVSKIVKEHANQTVTGKVRTALLPKSDILLESVIQNISAKLSPFNGTLLQRLESYLRTTSYPLRQNQTIKTVAKAIFLYLVSKKPPNVREIVYDRLAEKTQLEVTTSFPQPTLPSDRVKVQGSRGISSLLTEQDLDSDDKNSKETSAKVQKKFTASEQQVRHPTSEPRKETNSSRSKELRPTLKTQDESYRAREALRVEQKSPNRTTTDNRKHARPYVVNHTSTSITVSLDGLKGHSNNVVIYYRDIQADFKGHRLVFPGDADVAKIPGLSPGRTYRIDLHGVFKGQSSKSYSIVTSTAPESGQLSTASDVSPTPWVGGGDSTQEPPSILYEPLGDLSVTDISSDSLTLSWKADPGVFDQFAIRYKDSVGLAEVLVPGDKRTTELKLLRPGSEYEIQLQGVSEGLHTEPITINATTASRKPQEPPSLMGGLTVTGITQDSFNIVWKARKGVFDSFLVRYEDVGGWLGSQEISVPGDSRATAIEGLDAGTEYTLSLYGVRKGQLSRALKTKVTTASAKGDGMPARVEDLSTSDVQNDSVRLSWIVHDGDFDFFLIQYRDADGQSQELTIRGDQTSVIVPGLRALTNYTFILYGISDDKESEPISVDLMTGRPPPRLGDLTASDATENSLRLSWNVQDGKFDSFLLQYRDSQGRSETLPIESGLHTVTVSGLHPAEAYTFELYGISSNKQSEPIEVVAKTASSDQAASRMGALSASNITGDSIQLSWTVPGGDFDSFLIKYRDAEGNPQELHMDGDLRSATVTGLRPSKKYKFSLHGVSGDRQAKPISTEVTTAAAAKAMIQPRLGDLNISNISWDSLRLSWTVPGGAFDSFLILYKDTEGKTQELPVPGDLRIATVSGLKPSKKYKFLLHGISGAKRSKPVTAEATTAAAAGKATITPRLGDLTISNITQNSLRLSWTVLDEAFDSFLILYRDTEGRTQELPVPGNLRIATISGLKPSKKYKFLLHGISGGKRSKQMTAEATTAAPPKKTVDRLPKLGDLSISEIQKDTLTLSWTVTNDEYDSFLILYKDSEGTSQELAIDGDLRSTTVKGLKPSKKYKFALYGVSDDRRGQPISAEAITAATKDPLTPSPRLGNLTVSEVAKDSLRLSWTLQSGGYDTFLIIYKNAEGLPQGVPLQRDQRTALVTGLAPSTNYTFLLFGVTGRNRSVPISASATTESDQAVPPLPVLEDLLVSNITKDSLHLSWSVGAGDFDSFLIQYRDPEGKPQELLVDGDQHTAKVSGLVPSEKYTFYLQGITGTDRVGPIAAETVTASSEKPIGQQGRLGDLSVSDITRDSLRLSWTISVGDFDSFLIQYRDADGKVQELPVNGDRRSATISGLRPSKKYKFILYGMSGNRRSKSISTEATTAPAEKAPTRPPRLGDLSVSDITKDSLQLSWDIEDGAFGSFLIQYKDAEGVLRELTVDGDFRTARIVGLKPAKKYKFSLFGVYGDRRTKAVSTEATTAQPEKAVSHSPRLGEFFVSDITKDSLQLTWTVEDGDFDSFVIQYRDADGQTQELVVDGDIHTTTVAGLLPSRKYKFNLYGISNNKRTKPLSTDATTAYPEAVGQQAAMLDDLYLSDVGPYTAQLSWVASEGAFDSFLIQYVVSQAITPPREMVVEGDRRTAQIGSLQPNTEYTFTLTGLQRGQKRADLNTVGRTSRLDLEPPRDLQFRNVQETSVMVSWTPPTTSVDTFKVSYQLADGGEPQSITMDGKSNKAPLKGLTPGNRYEVNVMSIRGFEESEPLTGYVTTVPDGPTDLRATNVTETSALLLWRPALASVDTYVITYSAQNVPAVTKTLSGNIAELQLNGLKINTEYTAQIHSAKGSNRSSPATTTFTTSADAPRDLTASRISPQSAVLSWTPPQAIPTGYILSYEAPSGETKEIKLDASANSYKLIDLIPSSQYRARVQALRGRVRTAPTSTMFTTARLRYPYPKDCAEERLNGASRSKPVTIYLNGDNSRPVQVFCDMETDGGGWMVFQRRMNGKTNFWRNWVDYAKGFGNLTQEFWLGNENLHKLTSQDTYELRVDLRIKNESAYALYDSFRVDTEANYYRLRIGKYSGNAGDSLSYHNNMIFSTRDRDRNKHIMPCAISYRGAWWYKNCHYVNLNGLYGNNKDHQGVNWYSWKGFEFSIPFTEMKMRPKNTVALRRI